MSIDLHELYFYWILKKVGVDSGGYNSLMRLLFNREFYPILLMDANRYEDGIYLRYQFGYESGIPESDIAHLLGTTECTVLEMMAALAIRSEDDTMSNSTFGDRTYIWFWDMIRSLGLDRFDDSKFIQQAKTINKVDAILNKFMNRLYKPNGAGGLVTLNPAPTDMRVIDIWTQMSWKLDEYVRIYGG